MFSSSSDKTIIAKGLRIEGRVIADGLVEVHGSVEGDLQCTSLEICDKAQINGSVAANSIVVHGAVDGPVRGADVILGPQASVNGDIHCTTLSIDKGAVFNGRSRQGDSVTLKKAPARRTDDPAVAVAELDDDAEVIVTTRSKAPAKRKAPARRRTTLARNGSPKSSVEVVVKSRGNGAARKKNGIRRAASR